MFKELKRGCMKGERYKERLWWMASRLKIYKGNNVKRFNWGRVVKRGLKEGVKEIEKERMGGDKHFTWF